MRPAAGVLGAALAVAALAGPALPGASGGLAAQGTRGWATTTARYLELPGPVRDPSGGAVGTDLLGGWTGTQDVALTAWGLGMRGLSVTTLLRARVDGGSLAWPRADDGFDAMLLYAQLDGGGWRIRAGRQETASGLGFSAFDGAALRVSVAGVGTGLSFEAFGGRSLARGLSEPRDEALRGLEDFVPDTDAWIVGGVLEARLAGATSASVRYQREIWADRSGLISERAAVDVRTGVFGPVRVTGSADWDFPFARVGKAHLTASFAPSRTTLMEATLRRYVPYFELSTIWGFFEPVPYHEAVARISVSAAEGLGVWATGGVRRYEAASGPVFLSPLEDRGWRGEAGVVWRPAPVVGVTGRYEIDWLPGAFLQGGTVDGSWTVAPQVVVGASLTTFQRFEEFRLGDGRAVGVGLNASAGLTSRTRVDAGLARYRHSTRGRGDVDPWHQDRAWVSFRVALGDDPGLRGRAGAGS